MDVIVPRRKDRSSAVREAAKKAALPAGTTTHDLRHHYANVLLAAGESVVAVAERLATRTQRSCSRPTAT